MEDIDSWLTGESRCRSSSTTTSALCDVLRSLLINNLEHFQDDKTSYGTKFTEIFTQFLGTFKEFEPSMNTMARLAPLYDLNDKTPGNGYRSVLVLGNACVLESIRVCRTLCVKRSSLLFRKQTHFEEVKSYADLMKALCVLLDSIHKLHSDNGVYSLFPTEIDYTFDWLTQLEKMDIASLYGRCFGFQLSESVKKPLHSIVLLMTSFSDGFYSGGGLLSSTTSSLFGCGKYALYPEKRAKRMGEIVLKASVDFIKAFWNICEIEIFQKLTFGNFLSLPINKVLLLPTKPLNYYDVDGKVISIPVPSSHIPPSPIPCRLLSYTVRQGQVGEQESSKVRPGIMPPSPYLIVHCHGGGFVAHSSKAHEVYLKAWSKHLDVPILSIDYTLATKAPYPRALEECFFAYVWALENCSQLGSTGEKICLVGDSAGGNLIMGTVFKAMELGIRLPDGLLPIYAPFFVAPIPTPSRANSVMDVLVPFGFLLRCSAAYLECPKDSSEIPGIISHEKSNSNTTGPISTLESESSIGVPNFTQHRMAYGSQTAQDAEVSDLTCTTDKQNVLDAWSNESAEQQTCSADSVLTNTNSSSRYYTASDCFEEVSADELVNLETLPTSAEGSRDILISSVQFNGTASCNLDSIERNNLSTQERKCSIENEISEAEENIVFETPQKNTSNVSEKSTHFTKMVPNAFSVFQSFKRKTKKENVGYDRNEIKEQSSDQKVKKDRQQNEEMVEKTGIQPSLEESLGLMEVATGAGRNFKQYFDKNFYISPYFATDDCLKKLPPIHLVSTMWDPFLDDSVMFAKRMQQLGKEVGFDILDGLPHGFLNLLLLSKDADEGSKTCVQRLSKLLGISTDQLVAANQLQCQV